MLYGPRPDGPPYFTADLIRAIQPGARIIVILREPTSRLYSEYLDLDAFWPLFKSPEDFHVRVEDVIGHFNRCLETRHVAGCASNYYQPVIKPTEVQVKLYQAVHYLTFYRCGRSCFKKSPPHKYFFSKFFVQILQKSRICRRVSCRCEMCRVIC